MKEGTQDRLDYKIVALTAFLSITAPYWISYSALVTIKYSLGTYEPKVLNHNGWLKWLSKVLFLTFIGPLTTFLSQLIIAVGDCIIVLMAFIVCIDVTHLMAVK